MTNNTCPQCGGKLRKRTSKKVGSLREARRECVSCDYHDTALIRPEQIISVFVVPTTTDQSSAQVEGV